MYNIECSSITERYFSIPIPMQLISLIYVFRLSRLYLLTLQSICRSFVVRHSLSFAINLVCGKFELFGHNVDDHEKVGHRPPPTTFFPLFLCRKKYITMNDNLNNSSRIFRYRTRKYSIKRCALVF